MTVPKYETLGIKQVIRFEWMQKTVDLLLEKNDKNLIRKYLHEFLNSKKGSGAEGNRSDQTRSFTVNNLMRIWISPGLELIPFRDDSLEFLRENPSKSLAIHWGMISSVYPFWFNVARQTGRLLSLQNQVSQNQIINRLKEQYGDRQSVSRYARFVIRSFVAWGILQDSKTKGCYEKVAPVKIDDMHLMILMLESGLLATKERKNTFIQLMNNPAFFPFSFPSVSSDFISHQSDRIDTIRCGVDEVLLKIKTA